MKLIESKAEYIPQASGLEGIFKQIELAGRTAYKSESNITDTSAKSFVDRMVKSYHNAVLEHGTVYLKVELPKDEITPGESLYHYKRNPYSRYNIEDGVAYVTTNYRVLVENDWLEDLIYLCEPSDEHDKRYTMRLTCDRGVSHELIRHRAFSFLQESTRYCNYSKKKFDNEITFIEPSWEMFPFERDAFITCLRETQRSYISLIDMGWKPQQARQVLPNALKTEVIMTGFASDWKHFFDLRLDGITGPPHPDMKALAEKARDVMIDEGIWEDVMISREECE